MRSDLLRAVFLRAGTATTETSAAPLALLPTMLPRRPASNGDQTLLDVTDLAKSYGGRAAIHDVSLTLRRGIIVGLIGPNGAGKTTLLDIISGVAEPDRGSVVFAGEDVTLWTPDRRARLGMSRRFRDARLFPTLTVEEILTICVQQSDDAVPVRPVQGVAAFRPRRSRSVDEAVDGLIELLRLKRHRDSRAADLSTGTRRIVDLAAAIAAGPQLLLLDEPASGLAQSETEELAPILRQVRNRLGCAVVIIEHDINLVAGLADELIVLHLGQVLTRGKPDEVLQDDAVLTAYFGESPAEGGLPSLGPVDGAVPAARGTAFS